LTSTSTFLAIDIGNTQCKIAIMQNAQVLEKHFCAHETLLATVNKLYTDKNISASIICNVVQTMQKTVELIATKWNAYILNDQSKLPFHSMYQSMQTLGLDRMALLAAASVRFKNQNTLIIALGTCITYNILEETNTFLGGSISPGMYMRYKAMHEFTKGLPQVEPNIKVGLIGQNTIECLQSGVQHGIAAELNEIIAQYNLQYKNLNVVLTGGDSLTFATQIKYKIFADENFLFSGLYEILQIHIN
jgi:type III pantothenate kinase